ncbi:MAG TPA: proton-conducting transporter membrane subunit [Acidimicrobiales bacterium]|nr:proton-conducting transporter membrane subunit [Acidimicrobiales bacterium]
MVALVILMAPLLAALAAPAMGWRRAMPWIGVVADGSVLVAGLIVALHDVNHVAPIGAAGYLRIDALSAFMVMVIGAVSLLASWGSVRYLRHEVDSVACTPRQAVQYSVLIQLFVATMLLAVTAANIGVLWVAVEATTITTTFLVGHRRTRGALEASWKYLVICSVGIALAFLGTVILYLAAQHAGGTSNQALDWTWLSAHARTFNPSVVRLAIGLLVLGYGAKVGLVPMHSWLPDAHSQAPAPVSALMSGVLLSVALYALLRFKAIAVLSVGEAFPRALFMTLALLSVALAALLLITQRDMKRALAYSSTEHMGLMALAVAAGGPLAITGVLLHMLGHGLAKGVLFLSAGEIVIADGTSDFTEAAGLLTRRPGLGGSFGLGLAALLGFPPFSLFVSEITMIRGELAAHLAWAVVLSLVALAVAFAALATHGRRLLLSSTPGELVGQRTPAAAMAPLVVGLALCAFVGVSTWPLGPVLRAAAKLVVS